MKRFLKILAIILVVIAISALLSAAFQFIGGGQETFMQFLSKDAFWSMTWGQVILLGAVGLVLAAVISPEGASKALTRVAEGTARAVNGVTKVVSKTAAGAIGGLLSGFFSGGNLWLIIAAAIGIYYFWPDKEERRSSRDAKLASELRIKEMEAENRLQSRQSKAHTSDTMPETVQ